MNDTRIVNAIQARINGVWDDPDLLSVGPLQTDEAKDIVQILSMRDRTPGNTTVEEFTEFMEADSLQGCRESDRIAEGLDATGKPAQDDESPIGAMTEEEKEIVNPFDTMDWGDGKAKPLETIDLTPVGCQTPAGCKRVSEAMADFDNATRIVADLATEMVDTLTENSQYPSAKFDALKASIQSRRDAQNALLKAVSGR